jgi:hypothetical protein
MKKRVLFLFIVSLVSITNLFAQEPTLRGTIKVSITNGTIDADFTLSHIPAIKNYEILINSGLNINVIRQDQHNFNHSYNKVYNPKISEESFLYSIEDANGKFLPKELRFVYSGKFPVKLDSTSLMRGVDWKGNIAFNGKTLRMDGAQSNWYPVLYDVEKDKKYYALRYDVDVICEDCETLYLNGSSPVSSKEHNFKSDIPTEILMFVGNYNFEEVNETYYLNPDISYDEIREFSLNVEKFKAYYSKNLKIPYKGKFSFLQTTPLFLKKGGFLFVSYPTITNVGTGNYGLKGLVGKTMPYTKPLMAHELAHYYFGSGYKKFNSEIGNVIQEGFAEYLSFKASKNVLGLETSNDKLKTLISSFEQKKGVKFLPVSQIKSKDDFNNNYYLYVYNYFPTILLAIEKEVGEPKMWQWMNYLLTTNAEFTDFNFLQTTFKKAVNNDMKSSALISKYFILNDALTSALEKLNEK